MNKLWGALLVFLTPSGGMVSGQTGNEAAHNHGTSPQMVSDALRICLGAARRRWPTVPLTDAMIVWAILSIDNPACAAVVAILPECEGLTLEALLEDLERRIQRSGSHMSPQPLSADHSLWMPIKLGPHPQRHHLMRHESLMLSIADAIEARGPRAFVLVSGLNGSPLHYVPQILADAVGDNTSQFADSSGIWLADAVNYMKWANPPATTNADLLLEEGIQYVKERGGIFVLEHVEKLKEATELVPPPLQQRLLGQLTSIPEAKIIALYETARGYQPDGALAAMGLTEIEAIPVPIDPYSVEWALNSLRDNFVPHWRELGFLFDGDVTNKDFGPFHDLLTLAPGAYVHEEPMAFPYLLVEVAELVFRRKDAPESFKGWANTARDRVNKLQQQPPSQVPKKVVQHFAAALDDALAQILILETSPGFDQQSQHIIVTRAHLTAAFLGSALSRFAFPAAIPGDA